MRRLLVLLLALTLCLGLCACGETPDPTEPPTDPPTDPTEPEITDHPFLEMMYGEWFLRKTNNPHYFSSLIVNPDGTCVVDGETLTWKIYEQSTEDMLFLSFYRGEELVCGAAVGSSGYLYDTDGTTMPNPAEYFNLANATREELIQYDPQTYLAPILCGQWVLVLDQDGVPTDITINSDGTFVRGEETGTWTVTDTLSRYNHVCDLEFLIGDTVKHTAEFKHTGREYHLSVTDGERTGSYLNTSHYDIIEITNENLMEYFELKWTFYWNENAFGEVESKGMCQFSLHLKDEYAAKLSGISMDNCGYMQDGNRLTKNALQIRYSVGKIQCDVDLQSKVCNPREGEVTFREYFELMDNFYYHIGLLDYSVGLPFPGVPTEMDEMPWLYDFEVLRSDCPLYLIKDEFLGTEE